MNWHFVTGLEIGISDIRGIILHGVAGTACVVIKCWISEIELHIFINYFDFLFLFLWITYFHILHHYFPKSFYIWHFVGWYQISGIMSDIGGATLSTDVTLFIDTRPHHHFAFWIEERWNIFQNLKKALHRPNPSNLGQRQLCANYANMH